MEGIKQKGTCSSFTSELFGPKESFHPSSSVGIFGSIFSPPSSKVFGRESLRSETSGKFTNETWSSKSGIHDFSKGNDGEAQKTANKDMSSIYQDQKVHPCHLSSSIYYGGQDIYSQPQSIQNAGTGSNSLHLFSGGDKSTRTMEEKMIQDLPQEETGGKACYGFYFSNSFVVLSIIKISPAKAYAP
ncbi:hypothetical protein RJT34_22148 [Clitoria ternatea]|uniref:Uncharacterized protein n=1 Tax=Clitoria ternatea TaxID=43366 RepID=A0AAN9P6L2_CLITE